MDRSKGLSSSSGLKKESSDLNVLSSFSYLASFQNAPKDSTAKLDQSVYRSLQSYERQIAVLKGQVKLLTFQVERSQRGSCFYKILAHTKEQCINFEPFTEEERSHLTSLLQS